MLGVARAETDRDDVTVTDTDHDALPEGLGVALTVPLTDDECDAVCVCCADRVALNETKYVDVVVAEPVDLGSSGGGVSLRTLLPICSATKMSPLGATARTTGVLSSAAVPTPSANPAEVPAAPPPPIVDTAPVATTIARIR
jgi:hypothetical protein